MPVALEYSVAVVPMRAIAAVAVIDIFSVAHSNLWVADWLVAKVVHDSWAIVHSFVLVAECVIVATRDVVVVVDSFVVHGVWHCTGYDVVVLKFRAMPVACPVFDATIVDSMMHDCCYSVGVVRHHTIDSIHSVVHCNDPIDVHRAVAIRRMISRRITGVESVLVCHRYSIQAMAMGPMKDSATRNCS